MSDVSPFSLRSFSHPGWIESHVTLPGPVAAKHFEEAKRQLPGGADAVILGIELFGALDEIAGLRKLVEGVEAPVTAVLSTAERGGGMQFCAATGASVTPLKDRGHVTGFLLEDASSRRVFLGGLTASDRQASRSDQTREVFSRIESTLMASGFGFQDVVRTWFYNENILDWYGDFNAVRTEFFKAHGVSRMPASTGIGAPNPAGTALVCRALAVSRDAHTVESPLQCDAFAYGSAFSRAMEITDSHSGFLSVSGTASIEPGGLSVHQNDTAAQIALTWNVVDALVRNAGYSMTDAVRAIAYFRHPADIPLWQTFADPSLPCVTLGSHVCRDDLLFELEVDVARSE